ncbi:hypothetical protein B484DRAFT_403143 [Ochromonadaceae sp. CCMP2298]|nr:hypothetical protein B484DRAFT_403143 [Ochromonadaceae sp. CCMP2298]
MLLDVLLLMGTVLRQSRTAATAALLLPALIPRAGAGIITALSCLRLLRLLHLPAQFRTAAKKLLREGGTRMPMIFLSSVLYASSAACMWFALSCGALWREGGGVTGGGVWAFTGAGAGVCVDNGHTWVSLDSQHLPPHRPLPRYLRALHFVTQTMFTVGYGDISPVSLVEVVFSLWLVLSGTLFYGYVISACTSMLSSHDFTTKLFRHQVVALKTYLHLRQADEEVQLHADPE